MASSSPISMNTLMRSCLKSSSRRVSPPFHSRSCPDTVNFVVLPALLSFKSCTGVISGGPAATPPPDPYFPSEPPPGIEQPTWPDFPEPVTPPPPWPEIPVSPPPDVIPPEVTPPHVPHPEVPDPHAPPRPPSAGGGTAAGDARRRLRRAE
ncbi:unnamed protein product [Spirodela intermedia]|uniref:Uncharacterized protein n=1 Tax=Spirodela intermedia TaxID=51605 RepID=A0A7I8I7T9_SPIIN|nr:unnamed protein product [Spirodela intermedia]CAA6653696.1 unnamed protein product [Spirodela intermedia]